MLGELTTRCQHSRYVWHLAGIFGTEANRSVGLALRKPWCSCDSANRLWKDLNLSSVLFGRAFRFQPDFERVSDFAACPRTIQWIWIHWAWLFCRPLERLNRNFTWNRTFTWNFPLLSANISPQLDDLLCQIPNVNSRLKLAITFRFTPTNLYSGYLPGLLSTGDNKTTSRSEVLHRKITRPWKVKLPGF